MEIISMSRNNASIHPFYIILILMNAPIQTNYLNDRPFDICKISRNRLLKGIIFLLLFYSYEIELTQDGVLNIKIENAKLK